MNGDVVGSQLMWRENDLHREDIVRRQQVGGRYKAASILAWLLTDFAYGDF